MRHMRSRRILAMLLALSMIFGLLTTTAFAGEVDQNTSNVGESAANGTSEGGSGEGQSSGASEGESSKETNKEDVPAEEETIPEEKKTTSSEEVDTQVGEGKTPVEETTYVASIGEQGYASLDAAIQAAQDNDIIVVSAGEYTLNGSLTYTNKAFTIKAADGETVSFDMSAAVALHGAKITFEGVTFDYRTNGNYIGLQHADTLVYNGCTINGKVFLYASKETFNNCTFIQDRADYNVWTYGAAETTFNDCTFNCKGKAVLVYNEGYIKTVKVEVSNTTFAASETVDKKAAIELDTHLMKGASITVDNASTATGFSTNTTDGAGLWNAKRIDSENNETVEVVVGGEVKYTLTTAPVAMVNGVSYDKLEDAFAALSDKAYTLTLNDESAWDTATPVYWAAGEQNGYAATLAAALTAAFKANAGDITIICRPNADVGTMTHGHVADDLTIYGNNAYVSAGECDLEVDTYKYDRSTGMQYAEGTGTDADYLGKDITITAYELDNLGVWGQRHTSYTVNVNLTDCDTVHGITVQRVYISGETGVNNITLSGCDFGTKATSVYSNADGKIDITDCSFTGAQVPVNFNHKANGEQTVTVTNSTFTSCGDTVEWPTFAAPVRFVNSGSGKQSATVDTCTFAGTVGSNGDILIGDGRTGQESNDVSLTVTNTEATVMAQQPGYYKDDGTTDNALKGEKALTAGETLTNASINSLISGTTATKGTEANPYTLEELGKMTRAEYIDAQTALGGTMYVTVGNYSYDTDGVLGNGVRDDTPGQTGDPNVLNGYNSNGYLGTNNDGANGLNIVFVNGSITSGVTGYTSIDNIGTSLLLAVPAYTNVTFKGITFKNVMRFNYQLYTGPWSQLGELKFDGCTFNGIIIGATAAQTLTFNSCTFNDYTNTTDANSSNPTWIRPAYGNWTSGDNKGQGSDFRSLTTINFTNNTVTSTRPVKFEYISQWNNTTTLTATGNTFDISAQDGDTETKNVGLYIGPHTDKNAVDLVLDKNTKSERTAALYVIPKDMSKLPVGSTVKDSSGTEIEITDALEWKTDTKVTLKTEPVPAVKNVAKVGDTEYSTLKEAIDNAEAGQTVTLIADVNTPKTTYVVSKDLTIDLNGKTVTGYGYDGVFQIDGANAKVLIKNGNVVAVEKTGSAGKYAMAVWACAENCEVTLEDLTVTQDITHTDDKQMDMIYTSKGKIIINSGSFTSGTPAWTLNCKDSAFKDGSAKIIVNGGEFVGFDPRNNKAEGTGTSFVADGVGVDYGAETSTFTAKANMTAQLLDASGNSVKAYKTLAEAFTEASEGQTVRLLANATEDVTIDKNITLDLGGKTLTNAGAGKATISVTGGTVTVKNGSVFGGTSYYNIEVTKGSNANLTLVDVTATAGNTGSSMVDNWGTLTIKSGTYTGGLNVVKSEEGSKLTINGGKFTLDYATSGYTGVIFAYGDTTITGGEFIQSLTTTGRWNHPQVIATGVVEGYTAITRVTGGTFTNKLSGEGIFRGVGKGTSDNFEVSGGTFNKSISEDYCAKGFIPTKNADGTYGVKEGKYVAKIGSTGYETLAAAIAKANSKSKPVTLVADVTESIEIAEGKTCKIDLNGFTLTNTEGSHTIVNNGTLTITDSSAAKSGTVDNVTHQKAAIVNYGTMTLAGGTYTRSLENPDNNKDSSGGNSFYTILNDKGGSLTIKDGVTVTNVGHFSSMIRNGGNDKESTLIIEGGTFSGGLNTVKNDAFGNLTISGGSFSNTTQCVVMNWHKANITGGTFELGENVNSTLLFSVAYTNPECTSGQMTISGGTFMYTETQGLVQDTFSNGKYTGTLAVSGGTFDQQVPEKYCATGYVPTENEDGTYGVVADKSVAEVDGQKYLTLQEAIDALSTAGDKTLKLLADVTNMDYTVANAIDIKLPAGATLDGNGKTISGNVKITVASDGGVTIKNANFKDIHNAAVVSDAYKTKYGFSNDKVGTLSAIYASKLSGSLTITGCSFENCDWEAMQITPAEGANITIKNNVFTNSASETVKEQLRHIHIEMAYGTDFDFEGQNITLNITDNQLLSDTKEANMGIWWVGKGSTLSLSGNYYNNPDAVSITLSEKQGTTFNRENRIDLIYPARSQENVDVDDLTKNVMVIADMFNATTYSTLEEAIAAAQKDQVIKLLADCSSDRINLEDKSIKVALNGHTLTSTAPYGVMFCAKNGNTITIDGTAEGSKLVGTVMITNGTDGHIVLNGGTYENAKYCPIYINGAVSSDDSTLTVTNATIRALDGNSDQEPGVAVYLAGYSTSTFTNTTIAAPSTGLEIRAGKLTLNGCNVTGGNGVVTATEDGSGSTVLNAAIAVSQHTTKKPIEVTINGGTYKATAAFYQTDVQGTGSAGVKTFIKSGTFNGTLNADTTGALEVSGGTFSNPVPADYCAEGFVPVTNGDGTYGVQPDGNVAEIGSVKYKSLDDALKAAKDRETVKLLKDVEATQVLVTKGTLDLNGKTLKVSYFMSFSDVIDSTEGNGLIETGVQSFFTTNNSYLPLRDSAANGYRLFSYKLNKLGVVEGSSTAFWFNIIFGGEKAYSLLNTAGHNADLFIPMQIGSGNEWQYIKMNQSTLTKWTTPILNGTAPSKCGYYVNITGLDTLTSGTVLTLKTSIRSCGVEKLSDDSLTYTVK